ncbi:MAG TPA: hypothetical protein VN715_13085 [Roseiarcus sp.]|nr:hypothetical protein [Roseiarcus sp.]
MKNGEREAETAPLYLYLAYGGSPAAERELRYSFETLHAEVGAAPIAIYTDRPAAYADLDATVVDATALVAAAQAHEYRHRLKPTALADALARFRRPCVMLDLDSFVKAGFAARVQRALAQGAAMNFLVRADPYPDFPAFETDLPHLGRYRLDRAKALMLNSGLVAVSPAHLPLVEDAVALIDRLWAAGLRRHDIEQFALAETLRLGGVRIALIDDVFVHYCARWARRYMRRRLRRRRPGARVPFSKAGVRLFKAYWTLRLAMRRAGLSWGARWRKT